MTGILSVPRSAQCSIQLEIWQTLSGLTVVHTFSFSQSEVPVAFMFLSVVESSRPVCVRTITPMILATVAACSSDDTRRARWPRQTSCLAVNWNEKILFRCTVQNGYCHYLGTGAK